MSLQVRFIKLFFNINSYTHFALSSVTIITSLYCLFYFNHIVISPVYFVLPTSKISELLILFLLTLNMSSTSYKRAISITLFYIIEKKKDFIVCTILTSTLEHWKSCSIKMVLSRQNQSKDSEMIQGKIRRILCNSTTIKFAEKKINTKWEI